jgi:hypothetical protein
LGLRLLLFWLFRSGPFNRFAEVDAVCCHPFVQTFVELFVVHIELQLPSSNSLIKYFGFAEAALLVLLDIMFEFFENMKESIKRGYGKTR